MKYPVSVVCLTFWLGACAYTPVPESTAVNVAAAARTVDTDDPYLWLEDVSGDAQLDWVRAQNKHSLAILESDSRFDTLYEEALGILTSSERIPYGNINGEYVYNFWQDDEHVRGLWRRARLSEFTAGNPRWQTLLDVDALAKSEDRNWVYDGVRCLQPEYRRCMVGLSDGGTDASYYREFSMQTLGFVDGGFQVPEAKSSIAWIDEDTLLIGTDWGEDSLTESGYARQIKTWRRGTPLASARKVFEGRTEDVGVFATTLRDERRVWPVALQAITFFESQAHVELPDGRLVTLPFPRRASIEDIQDGRLIAYLKEQWDYQGRIYPEGALVAIEFDDAQNYPAEMIYEPRPGEAIEQVELGKNSVFVALLDNVIGRVKRLQRSGDGWSATTIELPDNGKVALASANGSGNELLVSYESLTVPNSLFYVDANDTVSVVQSLPALYDADDVVVEQRFARSADGTRVPYFLMGKKSVLAAGPAPTIQYGYGGFEASILPTYYEDPGRPQHGALAGRMWVSRGGVLAISNIRGGGEYGPSWHKSALKENRHLAFEDFFAIGDALVADGVTTPAQLGAIGRSNGGLLMGAALTQRPDLYAAIDCGAPLLDMLRYHKLLAGASWVGEFGNPDIPEERAYIERYSPYQALSRDADYPPVFFYTSTKDDRVHPGHARKMAARMAEFGHEFLYYENIEGGHGGTSNQKQLAYRTALEYLFFLRTLM